MAEIDENREAWESSYDWSHAGDEWSAPWGDTESEWWGTVFPRIHSFVPVDTILEIGPGFGRWAQYLRKFCNRLILVDLAQKCIDNCRGRFSSDTHLEYFVNDGRSLAMLPDASVDFAFSFDSLVHAEADVMESYLNELAKKLKPNGAAFLHHSNAGAYRRYFEIADSISLGRTFLKRARLLHENPWRATSMTADRFATSCMTAGLQCVSQELINWESGSLLTDCLSVVTRREFGDERTNRIVRNPRFMREAKYVSQIFSPLYAREVR